MNNLAVFFTVTYRILQLCLFLLQGVTLKLSVLWIYLLCYSTPIHKFYNKYSALHFCNTVAYSKSNKKIKNNCDVG